MKNPTSIEVKCECQIPFHAELVEYLQEVSANPQCEPPNKAVAHRDDIRLAVTNKMLFIKIHFTESIKNWCPKLMTAIKRLLNKDIVGTIKVGHNEITLIFL